MIRILSILPDPPVSREWLWRLEWAMFLYVTLPLLVVFGVAMLWAHLRKNKR
jgi:hypothetical protein